MSDPVVVDGESLSIEALEAVARSDAPVSVAPAAREAVRASRERIEEILESGEPVYGVNTGFGKMVTERIDAGDITALQENLLRSHAAGVGEPLDRELVRAVVVSRLNALVKGYSGVREAVVDQLVAMLNGGVHPVIPRRGSLGASGDLAPLAHLALVLIGEGQARVDGEVLPGEAALATIDRDPITLAAKEGLALINGTQLTVAGAALFVRDAERLVHGATVAGALTTEVTMGTTATSDPHIGEVRGHPGHRVTAERVRRFTAGSDIVESHRNCDRIQDAYSIRCLPQVHGAVLDAVEHLREVVERELNSATDNPLVFDAAAVDDRAATTDTAAVLSGGNFHGEPLALPLEYARIALAELAAIAERRIDRLLNPNVQEAHLPPFLARESGLESGLMIAQYTAASLVNATRAVTSPSTDTITVSGNQEDHVSMSAESALRAREVCEHVRSVVATELLCAAEALEFVDDDLAPGAGTAAAYEAVRERVEPLDGDRALVDDVAALEALLRTGTLHDRVEATVADRTSAPD
jgi:histidine ammonia-lyase